MSHIPPVNLTHLHGAVDLGAVKHEDKKLEVVQSRLPWKVFCLIDQILGGFQWQSDVDVFGPLEST